MEEKREGSRSLSQQEEDALQSIARSDLGGLFKARMDEGFTLLYANDSYYAIHGYTRGQLEQEMHGQAVGLVHPEDVAWVSEHLRRALAENQGTVSFEYRIVRRDGAVVWLLISAGLSQEDGGMVLSGMILDITARKAELGFSAFTSAGINQTKHQIILTVDVSVSVLLPGFRTATKVSNSFIVAETVIVGTVPDTYTYFSTDPDTYEEDLKDYILNNS